MVGRLCEHLSWNWGAVGEENPFPMPFLRGDCWQSSGRKRFTLAQDGSRAKTRGGALGRNDLEEQESREEITGVSETF